MWANMRARNLPLHYTQALAPLAVIILLPQIEYFVWLGMILSSLK